MKETIAPTKAIWYAVFIFLKLLLSQSIRNNYTSTTLYFNLHMPNELNKTPNKHLQVFVSYFYSTPLQDGEAPSPKQHASYPQPYVLGKGERGLLRGIELGLMGMHKGEISVLNIKPEYAFKHPKCTETPPSHINPSKPLQVFLKLIDFQHTSKSAPIIPCGFDELGVVKRTEVLGDGWETPRIPFEVHLSISRCRWMADLSLSGAPGETIFEGLEEIFCELGDGTLPPGIEDAVSEMKRGEKATVWCPESGARGGKKVPEPFYDALEEEVDEESTDGEFSGERFVEYEITLHDFTQVGIKLFFKLSREKKLLHGTDIDIYVFGQLQVRDLVGDGSVMKRILKKGRGEFPTDCPLEDTSVTFHLKVRQAGSTSWLTDTRGPDGSGQPLTVETGTGDLPEAIDSAVRLMIPEEVAFVTSDWRHSYQGREDIPDGMELESRVEFEIELVDFVPEKNWGEMTVDDMLGKCVSWKEQGNALFKKVRQPVYYNTFILYNYYMTL